MPGTTLRRKAMCTKASNAWDYVSPQGNVYEAWLDVRFSCVLGGLAQLARALAWHARGHRFDPDILHFALMSKRSLTY